MCSCFRARSLSPKLDNKKESTSLSLSTQMKDAMVQVVLPGGRLELYRSAIPASCLTRKHRGSCVATPDVFKRPHESLVSDDDILLPGRKYFVMSSNAVERLKRKHSGRVRTAEVAAYCDDELMLVDAGDTWSEESICSAREFYVSKKNISEVARRHKRRFVPPIQKRKPMKEPEWEPSLTSIQELSP